jgi:hypothetical protein
MIFVKKKKDLLSAFGEEKRETAKGRKRDGSILVEGAACMCLQQGARSASRTFKDT